MKQKREQYVPEGNTDAERLMYAMQQVCEKKYDAISEAEFDDPKLAAAFNHMLDCVMENNNQYLMRINDAMSRLANNSRVKDMLTQIKSQSGPLEDMKQANEVLSNQIEQNGTQLLQSLALTKQLDHTITPCADRIINERAMLEALVEAAERALNDDAISKLELIRACEVAKNNGQTILRQSKGIADAILTMSDQVRILRDNMGRLCTDDRERVNVFRTFADGLQSLTDNYDKLSDYCFGVGQQLHRAQRDIDTSRNDMYRHNSRPSMIDRVSVFFVDHLVLTWRLYLNIIEYENLKITQVNNTDRCKFGLWCAQMEDPQIKDSDAFKACFDAHAQLHKYAVACFLAKEESDINGALEEFGHALEACDAFEKEMDGLCEYFRSIGYTDETEVWRIVN